MNTYTKLAADGSNLPADATGHLAVRIDNPLLAAPLIVSAYRSIAMPWKKAAKHAESLEINDWSWCLPSAEQAFFIPDRTKYPALDKNYFPDFDGSEWIWTSTPDAEDPSVCAWFVSLDGGASSRNDQSDRLHVRAVRAGQF